METTPKIIEFWEEVEFYRENGNQELIDKKEKLRNEQQELYRRVAVYAIKEQQGNTRMRKHFQESILVLNV